MNFLDTIEPILTTFTDTFFGYLPNLIGGFLLLSVGLVLSQLVRQLLVTLSRFFKLTSVLRLAQVGKIQDVRIWAEIINEIIGWAVIVLFLIPAAEVWGLVKVADVLRQLLFYIPNVIVAVVIGFVGLVFANIASDLVSHGVKSMNQASSRTLSLFAKYSIIFFSVLAALDQLGVARELIRILFTGIVAMLALAGGLAFGLGGKDVAKQILDEMKKKVS